MNEIAGMKRLKAPKGWRILRTGTEIKAGDKFDCVNKWEPTFIAGNCVGGLDQLGREVRYIRIKTKQK